MRREGGQRTSVFKAEELQRGRAPSSRQEVMELQGRKVLQREEWSHMKGNNFKESFDDH